MLWLNMAVKELRVNRGFSLFFVLNLAMGLAGFVAVQSFGRSLNRHMDTNLRQMLTADLVLSATSAVTGPEQALIDQVLGRDNARARLVSCYSMARSGDRTEDKSDTGGQPSGDLTNHARARLVRIMAVDEAYPLYGRFVLETGSDARVLNRGPALFMTRDTAATLGVEKGDTLRIGDTGFFVKDFFLEDPDKSLTSVDLAPKVYMGLSQLGQTGLVRFGSRVRYFYFYRFDTPRNVPDLVHTLSEQFFEAGNGQPRINVFDTRDVNRQLGRLTRYYTGYMGLVGIVALFLAGISGTYLFRELVADQTRQMAVLMALGGSRIQVYGFVCLQLMLLGTAASMVAVGGALVLLPAFPVIFKGLVPEGLVVGIDPYTIALTFAMGIAGSLVLCLPALVRTIGVRPLDLLRGGEAPDTSIPAGVQVLSFVPGVAAFVLVAATLASSMRSGLVFSAGFFAALVLLAGAGALVFKCCGVLSTARFMSVHVGAKIALRHLYRHLWSSLACFVTIAMGVFLIALIPQIHRGLEKEIMRPDGLRLPVFFLVDIQDDQKAELISFMGDNPGELTHISPVVNGRISSVNGVSFFGRPGQEAGAGDRRGGRGVRRLEFIFSYRQQLADSESLVAGRPMTSAPWTFESGHPFEISVAQTFARRYDLKIGDVLRFDVQGIALEGQVVNLRKVRWNSFQPNFFLLFQDGVLNDAPKTHLGAISNVPPDQRQALKAHLSQAFPNVSVIDVTQTAATILSVTDRLLLSVRFMAWLAIGAGLVSIFSIARHKARKNQNQTNLLKVMGCGFSTLRQVSLVEFGVLGFSAALFAVVLSLGFSWLISWYFFDSLWAADPARSLAILAVTPIVCMVTGLKAAVTVMKSTPLSLLKEG